MNHPKLRFTELHDYNVMYDERNQHWDIIDGALKEVEGVNVNYQAVDNIKELFSQLRVQNCDETTVFVLDKLADIAKRGEQLTKDIDLEILAG